MRYEDSPSIAFMKECRKLFVPPVPLGLIKRKGQENVINVMNYNIGNDYAKALSASMKYIKPKAVLLGGNNNTNGIMNIITNLNEQ